MYTCLLFTVWPPNNGEEFSSVLPRHTADFLKCLPIPEYTTLGGSFNLNSQLPEVFMRSDLGPRVCLTYGNGMDSNDTDKVTFEAAWNLHTNLVDTLSLVIHAEVPRDLDRDAFRKEVLSLMDTMGCQDETSRRRVQASKELPAAIWQVFHPEDGDVLRDVLNGTAGGIAGTSTSAHPLPTNYDPVNSEKYWAGEAVIRELEANRGVKPIVIAQVWKLVHFFL